MDSAHNDREACWNEMLERWNELSWCAHAFHETDMVAAKILLWRDVTCEPTCTDAPASGVGSHVAPRRPSILPEGRRVVQVGGRAVWWMLLSTTAALGKVLR